MILSTKSSTMIHYELCAFHNQVELYGQKKIINVKRTEINRTGNRNLLKWLSLTPLVLD